MADFNNSMRVHEDRCWTEGYDASAAGVDRTEMPYEAGTMIAKWWLEGWDFRLAETAN